MKKTVFFESLRYKLITKNDCYTLALDKPITATHYSTGQNPSLLHISTIDSSEVNSLER